MNAAVIERLGYEAELTSGFRSPLARIETLAYEIGQTAPAALMQARSSPSSASRKIPNPGAASLSKRSRTFAAMISAPAAYRASPMRS
jgi:hypothetical protein